MVEELQVGIGADASQFIDETQKASRAFDKFTEVLADSADDVAKSSKKGRDAFGRFVKSTEKGAKATKKTGNAFANLTKRIKDTIKRVKEFSALDAGKGLVRGFRGLASIVATVTKTVLALGAALAGIGVAAAVSFAKFQREFSQVRTLVDESLVD
ncbi:hypothetical protein LCGC14_2335280, partial [marine sediment metagenome]